MSAESRRDVFQAIADPNRRRIIGLIAKGPLNLNSIAGNFGISRPAVSQHIKILTECGIVIIKQKGRERFCEAKFERLNEVSDWIESYRKQWERKFDELEKYLDKIQKKKKHGKGKK